MNDQSVSWPEYSATSGGGSSPSAPPMRWVEGETYPAVNRTALSDVARHKAARLIREAFPAKSRRETARRCAAYTGYSVDTVENILELKSGAPFDLIFAVGTLRGAWFVLEVMTDGMSRFAFLGRIAKGVRRVRR